MDKKNASRTVKMRKQGKIIEIDTDFVEIVKDLNKSGFETRFSCSGTDRDHPNKEDVRTPYISISLHDLDPVERKKYYCINTIAKKMKISDTSLLLDTEKNINFLHGFIINKEDKKTFEETLHKEMFPRYCSEIDYEYEFDDMYIVDNEKYPFSIVFPLFNATEDELALANCAKQQIKNDKLDVSIYLVEGNNDPYIGMNIRKKKLKTPMTDEEIISEFKGAVNRLKKCKETSIEGE